VDEDSTATDKTDSGDSKEDLSADNQLYEAVNLLKGFYLLGSK
jgi:hypothetical protein